MTADWRTMSLEEANVTLLDCVHKTPPASDVGFPYVAIPQIKAGRVDIADARRISREHLEEWTRKAKPKINDVILSRRCNPGETAFVHQGLECALGQNLVLLRSDGTKVFPPFLRWLVRGSEWWEQVGKFINVGAIFESLKCADIPKFELTIPPIDAQKYIAVFLGAIDDKIELNRQTNQTLEQIAQAIFKSWFVDFEPVKAKIKAKAAGRDPERAAMCAISGKSEAEFDQLSDDQRKQLVATAALFPDELVESELGLIPRGWGTSTIGKEFDVTMGQSPPGHTYNEEGEGIPFFQGRRDFGWRYPVNRVYCTAPKRYAKTGDTLLSVRAPVGDVNKATADCCIGRGLAALRHKSGCEAYTYYTVKRLEQYFSNFEHALNLF
ncbi:MAG: restriction endonuclease subunit S [Sulfurimonas sp.]|nr:restriction endonuclease subunit S [Sulfurimonas sp.]